jgi:hypothetical protein
MLFTAALQVEAQASCCSPPQSETTPQANVTCCAPTPSSEADRKIFEQFTELLSRYNVNDYAASVKVLAIKVSLVDVSFRIVGSP